MLDFREGFEAALILVSVLGVLAVPVAILFLI